MRQILEIILFLLFREFNKFQLHKQSLAEFSLNGLPMSTSQCVSREIVLSILNSSWSILDFTVAHKSLEAKNVSFEFLKTYSLHRIIPINFGSDAQNKPSACLLNRV